MLNGEDGNDALNGQGGDDTVEGGNGFDIITGGLGNDVLSGSGDIDYLEGNAGNDTLTGDVGNDRLFGGQGDDVVAGGADFDVLTGGLGADRMQGDRGNDDLFGNDGNDVLEGGEGADFLVGGAGADTFVFQGRTPVTGDSPLSSNFSRANVNVGNTQGGDVILDFNTAEGDVLDFFVSGAGGRYVEEQTVVINPNPADPTSVFDNARVLANQNLAANQTAIFVAVQVNGGTAETTGVILFFETSGDDTVDQQVFLQGVTTAQLANDGSFIV